MVTIHSTRIWQLRRIRAVLNWPLVIGATLIIIIVLCTITAPLITPHDPTTVILRYDGSKLLQPPYPPGTPGFLLGSDAAARDLLSRIVYGSRYTLMICGIAAVIRMSLGLLFGLTAGWYSATRPIFDLIVGAASALPSLLLAISIIPLIEYYFDASLIAFILATGLTGWTEIAVNVRLLTTSLQAMPFIEAASAVGVPRRRILWRHILPNLRDVLLIEASTAITGALLLLAELAAISYFVGGSQEAAMGSDRPEPIYAEWGSMLTNGLMFRSQGLWLLLVPFAAFTLSIIAFSLFAEGLRRRR